MASPVNQRNLADAVLTANVAMPVAANTVATNIIDLGSTTPYPVTEKIIVQLSTTLATGANSKNVNMALQECADTNVSNFTNIAELASKVIAGNTTKVPAATVNIALPPGVKRYIRAVAKGEADGGDSSDGVLTVKLLF